MIREGKKLPHDVKEKMPILISTISELDDILALYAFGGLTRGKLHPLSDLDFGVLFSFQLDRKKRFTAHLDLLITFNKIFHTDEIDLVNMNDASVRFSFNIFKTGKLLFCRKKIDLVGFIEQVIKLHLDFKFYRDRFDDVFLKGVGYYG